MGADVTPTFVESQLKVTEMSLSPPAPTNCSHDSGICLAPKGRITTKQDVEQHLGEFLLHVCQRDGRLNIPLRHRNGSWDRIFIDLARIDIRTARNGTGRTPHDTSRMPNISCYCTSCCFPALMSFVECHLISTHIQSLVFLTRKNIMTLAFSVL